jgi:6-phosphogluconolactonase
MQRFIQYLIILIFMVQTAYSEQYLYLSNKKGKSIDQYSINPKNGNLKLVEKLKLKSGAAGLSLSQNERYIHTYSKSELLTLYVGEKGKLAVKGSAKSSLTGGGKLSADGRFYVQYSYGANKVSVWAMKDYVFSGKQVDLVSTTDHPHDVTFSNDGNLVFVPHNWDNRLYQFKFNQKTGKLTPLDPPFITGPDLEKTGYANFRSLAQHPQKNVLYCTYEKGGGIASLTYDAKGVKIWQEFSSAKEGWSANASTLALTQDCRFLFMSNRGSKEGSQGSIAVFSLDPKTGEILKRVGVYANGAEKSREIKVDRSGKFIYSSSKSSTFIHHINKDGSLKFYKELKIGGGPMLILER